MRKPKILIVDDERIAVENLSHVFAKENYTVIATEDSRKAMDLLESNEFDIVLADLRMDHFTGIDILKKCKKESPITEVIIITAFATPDSAVTAMKNGAFYYISKPFKLDDVKKITREACEKVFLKRENDLLKDKLKSIDSGSQFLTLNTKMQKMLDTAKLAAASDGNIFISGESGTGKELFARYIYRNSNRRDNPFIPVNCGAFNEDLLANELFGHEKGAYTGAQDTKKGLLEVADGGILLLDELTEMSLNMQVKLLRVIQENEFLRIGGTKPVKIDVRFFATTNRNLEDAMREKLLRQDIFYRLGIFQFSLPPLRHRTDDIIFLTNHFIRKYAELEKKEVQGITSEALLALQKYPFPGNIRELENIIARTLVFARENTIRLDDLPENVKNTVPVHASGEGKTTEMESLEEVERKHILKVLKQVGNNRQQAAEILGIDRSSLWRKMKKYGAPASE